MLNRYQSSPDTLTSFSSFPLLFGIVEKYMIDFIIFKPYKCENQADETGELLGNFHVFATIILDVIIKKVIKGDGKVYDFGCLFHTNHTLQLNLITGFAVQSHFRRLQCLVSCFFSLLLLSLMFIKKYRTITVAVTVRYIFSAFSLSSNSRSIHSIPLFFLISANFIYKGKRYISIVPIQPLLHSLTFPINECMRTGSME